MGGCAGLLLVSAIVQSIWPALPNIPGHVAYKYIATGVFILAGAVIWYKYRPVFAQAREPLTEKIARMKREGKVSVVNYADPKRTMPLMPGDSEDDLRARGYEIRSSKFTDSKQMRKSFIASAQASRPLLPGMSVEEAEQIGASYRTSPKPTVAGDKIT